jgi:hypothetical protein
MNLKDLVITYPCTLPFNDKNRPILVAAKDDTTPGFENVRCIMLFTDSDLACRYLTHLKLGHIGKMPDRLLTHEYTNSDELLDGLCHQEQSLAEINVNHILIDPKPDELVPCVTIRGLVEKIQTECESRPKAKGSMQMNFLDRLREYYLNVAKVLRGEADAAKIFPNPTDKGGSRERVYVDFLRQHAPSKCNVFSGGFLFDESGAESKQLDVIITTDTAPRFNLHNEGGLGKSFSPVEGCLGVVSVKSNLNKDALFDALSGIGSIPPTQTLEGRKNPLFRIDDYPWWPLKVIYATDGIAAKTLAGHIAAFYSSNSAIPPERRPEFIHVLGKYLLIQANDDVRFAKASSNNPVKLLEGKSIEGRYLIVDSDPDLFAIARVLHKLQSYASQSSQINFEYSGIFNSIAGQVISTMAT